MPAQSLKTFLLLAVMATPMPALAQTSASGVGRTQLALTARLVVPYHMKVRQATPATVVSRGPAGTEVELRLSAASNADWTLALSPDATAGGGLEMLDENGRWTSLASSSPSAMILARGQATDGTPVVVRLRMSRGRALTDLSRLRFVMTPSEGAITAR